MTRTRNLVLFQFLLLMAASHQEQLSSKATVEANTFLRTENRFATKNEGTSNQRIDSLESMFSTILKAQATTDSTGNILLASAASGISINGTSPDGHTGFSVSSVGDINADGYDDYIVSTAFINDYTGFCTVLLGNANQGNIDITLSLDSSLGINIMGTEANSFTGYSVSAAGDLNGDGFADFLIGAPGANGFAGVTFIIYGAYKLENVNLPTITADSPTFEPSPMPTKRPTSSYSYFNDDDENDYYDFDFPPMGPPTSLVGNVPLGQVGYSVDAAGDFNGDGFPDVVIGATQATWPSYFAPIFDQRSVITGYVYVVFGGPNMANISTIDLGNLTSETGYVFSGDYIGFSVAGAGDVNGDGYDDIILGAPLDTDHRGTVHIIYGGIYGGVSSSSSREEFTTTAYYSDDYEPPVVPIVPANTIELSSLTSTQYVKMTGTAIQAALGYSVSGAGDVNDDGIDDVIFSAIGMSQFTGLVYVIYGNTNGISSSINLAAISATEGYTIYGSAAGVSGYSVSKAGDVNGDRVADVVVGSPGVGGLTGETYVIFGTTTATQLDIHLDTLSDTQGFSIAGISSNSFSGSSVRNTGGIINIIDYVMYYLWDSS